MTILFDYPQTFIFAKLSALNRFAEPSRYNCTSEGNLSYFTLYLTDNLTMTKFFLYLLTFS